jgi:hypothetical protein
MQHIGFALVGLGFFFFLSVAAVAGIVADYKKRHLELEPLRAAIERGQQLDPLLIERLMSREQRNSDPEPIYFRIGGILTVASGVGIVVLSFFVDQFAPQAFLKILGAGTLVVCVGVGLLISAVAIDRHLNSRASHGLGA